MDFTISYDDLMLFIKDNIILVYELYQHYYFYILELLSNINNIAANYHREIINIELIRINKAINNYYEINTYLDALKEYKFDKENITLLIADIQKYIKTTISEPDELYNKLLNMKSNLFNNLSFKHPFIAVLKLNENTKKLELSGMRNNNLIINHHNIKILRKYDNNLINTDDNTMTIHDYNELLKYGLIDSNRSLSIYNRDGIFEFEIENYYVNLNIINKPSNVRLFASYFNKDVNIINIDNIDNLDVMDKNKLIAKWLNSDKSRENKLNNLFNLLKNKAETKKKPIINEQMRKSFFKYIWSIKK
jgi:hypothetical protein